MNSIIKDLENLQNEVESDTVVSNVDNPCQDYISTMRSRPELIDRPSYLLLLSFYKEKSYECNRKLLHT